MSDAEIAKMHRINRDVVVKEVTSAGFKLVAEGKFLHRPRRRSQQTDLRQIDPGPHRPVCAEVRQTSAIARTSRAIPGGYRNPLPSPDRLRPNALGRKRATISGVGACLAYSSAMQGTMLDAAKQLAGCISDAGHEVWWDRHLHGRVAVRTEIDKALKDAEAVVVLWSPTSIEFRLGAGRGRRRARYRAAGPGVARLSQAAARLPPVPNDRSCGRGTAQATRRQSRICSRPSVATCGLEAAAARCGQSRQIASRPRSGLPFACCRSST